jgi:tungstate transport system ATP-binding protein
MIQGQRLADRMGVIINGRMAQVGSIHDIFYRPQGRDIARFVGIDTILNGIVESSQEGLSKILVGTTVFEVITPCRPGTKVALFIRPEEVTIALNDGDLPKTSVRNQIPGTIAKMVPFGPFVRTTIDFGTHLTSLVTRRSAEELSLAVGMKVIAGIKATVIHVIPDSG